MSDPKPTPRPRDRKARRKLSPGQVAYLDRKAERDKAKAEREAKQRLDGWYLHNFEPELAKAKRAKGVKNNAEASAMRRHSFVESFTEWPSVLQAGEMGYRIREWLRSQRKMKWRGCANHYPDKEESVRKKITELEVFRYNFRARLWFKCGSVEEAEATQRLAERTEEERLKRTRAPADWHHFIPDDLKPTMCGVLVEFNLLPEGHQLDELSEFGLLWVREEIRSLGCYETLNAKLRARRERLRREMAEAGAEAERAKQEAEEAERVRQSKPFGAGWYDAIPDELRPTVVFLWRVQSLDEVPTWRVEGYKTNPEGWHKMWQASREKQAKAVEDCLRHFQATHDRDREMRRVAEAVLVAD